MKADLRRKPEGICKRLMKMRSVRMRLDSRQDHTRRMKKMIARITSTTIRM